MLEFSSKAKHAYFSGIPPLRPRPRRRASRHGHRPQPHRYRPPNETIVLDAAQLRTLLAVDDVRKVHVRAEGSDKDLLVQAVDTNDDGVFEQLLFQADFAPHRRACSS
jgi:hypothetical protein